MLFCAIEHVTVEFGVTVQCFIREHFGENSPRNASDPLAMANRQSNAVYAFISALMTR